MELTDVELTLLSGERTSLGSYRGKALLVVNVASTDGLSVQYRALQRLHKRFERFGFSVLGFPCDQFGHHEPGTSEEIADYCATTHGVTFPVFEKTDVKGPDCHPLWAQLTAASDVDGRGGPVEWNFEKFVVTPELEVLARYRSLVEPEWVPLVDTVKSVLPENPGDQARRRTPGRRPGTGKSPAGERRSGPRVR